VRVCPIRRDAWSKSCSQEKEKEEKEKEEKEKKEKEKEGKKPIDNHSPSSAGRSWSETNY
jgi:hypothetical protein